MPKPHKNEKKEAYIARCMDSGEMNSSFPKNSQRYAVCLSYWTEHTKNKKAEQNPDTRGQ